MNNLRDKRLIAVRDKIAEARKFIPPARILPSGCSERSGSDITLECLADALTALTDLVELEGQT